MADRYIVVKTRIVGRLDDWSYAYESDLREFPDRGQAIDHGWQLYGHDDFSIATIRDGRLVAFGWMHDDFPPEDCDDLDTMARQLGLQPHRDTEVRS